MPRKEVDLHQLPSWLQYAIALTVVTAIATTAWIVGRERPVPEWIETGLVPALSWIVLFLIIFIMGHRLFKLIKK